MRNETKILLTSMVAGDFGRFYIGRLWVIRMLRVGMHQFTKHFAVECLAFLFSLEQFAPPFAYIGSFFSFFFCFEFRFHEKNVKLEQLFKIYCNASAFISFCIIQ